MKYHYPILCLGCFFCLSPILFAEQDADVDFADVQEAGALFLVKNPGEKGSDELQIKQVALPSPIKMVKLLNGDLFPAEWKQFIPKKKSLTGQSGEARLLFSSELLYDDIELDINQLDSLGVSMDNKAASGFALVQLSNGTYFLGKLLHTAGENIEVETMWGGKISLKKKMISSINMRSPSAFFYVGTDDLTGWKQEIVGRNGAPESADVWQVEDSCFVSRGNASRILSRTLELSDKVKVEMRLHYKGYNLRTTIALWGDRNEAGKPVGSLFLDVQGGFCQLHIGSDYSSRASLGTARFKVDYSSDTKKTMDIAFYADKAKRRFILYVNGQRVGAWGGGNDVDFEEEPVDRKEDAFAQWKAGKEVSFAVSGVPVEISQLSISRWRGSDPAMMLKTAASIAPAPEVKDKMENAKTKDLVSPPPIEKNLPAGVAKIQLVNGDFVIGEILEMGESSVRVKTPDYTVNIPMDRTLGFNLGDIGALGTQRLYANDIRIELVDKSNLILDLRSFDGTTLTGFSEATGEVKIKTNNIRNIFFNVHATKKDDKINALEERKSRR